MTFKKIGDSRASRASVLVMTFIILASSIVLAQSWPNPGHPAGQVGGGTFNYSYGDFYFTGGTKVGIGTTSPGALLHIQGGQVIGNTSASAVPTVTTAGVFGAGLYGVYGKGATAGVTGDSAGSASAPPVNTGVWGNSNAWGVLGNGGTVGVIGNVSGSGNLVTNTGVFGTGGLYGVYGKGSDSIYGYLAGNNLGVYGLGGSSYAGVIGNASSSQSFITGSDGGSGVFGVGSNVGVTGKWNSTIYGRLGCGSACGVGSGVGVYGSGVSSGAYAGYFAGNVTSTVDFCIASGGKCLSTVGTGTVSGSGTQYYVPRWATTTSLGDSAMYDNGGSIGISTTNPQEKLHVQTGSILANSTGYFIPSAFQAAALQATSSTVGIFFRGGNGEGQLGTDKYGGNFTGTTAGIYAKGTENVNTAAYLDGNVTVKNALSVAGGPLTYMGANLFISIGDGKNLVGGMINSSQFGWYTMVNQSANGWAIRGDTWGNNATGSLADFSSASGWKGVAGEHNSGREGFLANGSYGAYGEYDADNYGYIGSSKNGVYGLSWGSTGVNGSGNNYGVYGCYASQCADKFGYLGTSNAGAYGQASQYVYGAMGKSDGSNAFGVYGHANYTAPSAGYRIGVFGNASGTGPLPSADHTGVFGMGLNYGVYAQGGDKAIYGYYNSTLYGYIGDNERAMYGRFGSTTAQIATSDGNAVKASGNITFTDASYSITHPWSGVYLLDKTYNQDILSQGWSASPIGDWVTLCHGGSGVDGCIRISELSGLSVLDINGNENIRFDPNDGNKSWIVSGNLGIDTQNPQARLDAQWRENVDKYVILGNASQASTGSDDDNIGVLGIGAGNPGSGGFGWGIGMQGVGVPIESYGSIGVYARLNNVQNYNITGVSNTRDYALYVDGGGLGDAAVFLNGAVGIGTNAPSGGLVVSDGGYDPSIATTTGELYVEGDLEVDGDSQVGWFGDADRIKFFPSDFQAYGHNYANAIVTGNGAYITTAYSPYDLGVSVNIPVGYTATYALVYGSNSSTPISVYECVITSSTTCTLRSSACSVNTLCNMVDVATSTTNYLSIIAHGTSTTERVYGGYVTIAAN